MGKKSKKKQVNKAKKSSKKIGTKEKKTAFKPKTIEQFNENVKTLPNEILNKQKRVAIADKYKLMKNKIRTKLRKQRKKLPQSERQIPQTIEDKQQATQQFAEDYDEQHLDEFNKFMNQEASVKVLITTCLKPHKKIYSFLRQIMMVLHNVAYYPRRDLTLEQVYQYARQLGYSHVVVVRFTHEWEMIVRCLTGAMAIFRVTSVQFQKEIYHHAVATDHYPQLILNNFDSRVGVRVGRLLSSMFPQNPEFKGRRVVTFHNQRDFIFFRHHRYIFKQGFDGVNMQQIGPRFTLRLLKFYSGDQEAVKGLQFEAKDNMYVDRKKVYL